MAHFVLEWSRVFATLDKDADDAGERFAAPCSALVAEAAAAGAHVGENVVARLCAAAEELELFVITAHNSGAEGAASHTPLGAWCSASGEIIGYGNLDVCGAGAHGFHRDDDPSGN
jgi:hypothetical protein